MELDSARNLKRLCYKEILAPIATLPERRARSVRSFRGLSLAAVPIDQIQRPLVSMAIGVAHTRGTQYRLAVRCQRLELMESPEVAQIRKRAKDEVDVRFIGRVRKWRAIPWNQKRVRPLQIGVSCGHYNITAGTLGCFVHPRGDEETLLILSNNHVLADEDNAKVGDAILQPGSFDGGKNPKDLVARFTKAISLTQTAVNYVDAAVAVVEDKIKTNLRMIKGQGRLGGLGPEFLDAGTEVAKLGRTTGLTHGRISAFELDNVVVRYGLGDLRFDNQIEIEGGGQKSFSEGGDSGSLIVEANTREAIGLLFAGGDIGGSNGKGLTYANPIHAVLDALNIDLAL
jgi:hypothetical protein